MPLFFIGGDYFSTFLSNSWPIIIVFLVALGGIDAFFFLNWGLFEGLEREDWTAVAVFLEDRIFQRGWILGMYIRLLLNTYLVASNTESILVLESFLRKKKPGYICRYGIQFGIPHLLAKDPQDPVDFFSGLLTYKRVADRDWICWNLAFALLQKKDSDRARAGLVELVDRVRDPVLLLLALYLLDVAARNDPGLEKRVSEEREKLNTRHTPESFSKLIEKAGDNMEVVILAKLLQDALQWLFAGVKGKKAQS